MDDTLFTKVCVNIASGMRIEDALALESSDAYQWTQYLMDNPLKRQQFDMAQAMRVDITLDALGLILETESDVARAKMLSAHYLALASKQSPDKYGERKRIDIGMTHEDTLRELEVLEAAGIDLMEVELSGESVDVAGKA